MKTTHLYAAASIAATILCGYLAYQATSMFFLYNHWQISGAYEYFVYLITGATALLAFAIAWARRPRNSNTNNPTQPELSSKDRDRLMKHWHLICEHGTPEQKQEFIAQNPAFFGYHTTGTNDRLGPEALRTYTPDATKNERIAGDSSDPSLTISKNPRPPQSSSDNPQVEQRGNEIIIKLEQPKAEIPPGKTEENNGSNKLQQEMQKIFLDHLRSGRLKGTFKFVNGQFVIPDNVEFELTPLKPSTNIAPTPGPVKEEPKKPTKKGLTRPIP